MPDQPPPNVARGDRRDELWIETDADQLTRIRHGWPAGPLERQLQGEASEEGAGKADPGLADTAALINDESAWEAREQDD